MTPFRCQGDFAYRTNPDNTVDLICLYCYVVLIKTNDPKALSDAEMSHVCESKRRMQVKIA
jgi:hypothetical protein